jgi:hypothetical protein
MVSAADLNITSEDGRIECYCNIFFHWFLKNIRGSLGIAVVGATEIPNEP